MPNQHVSAGFFAKARNLQLRVTVYDWIEIYIHTHIYHILFNHRADLYVHVVIFPSNLSFFLLSLEEKVDLGKI